MATPQQVQRRGRWSLILGTLFAFVAFAAVAYADEIENNLPGTVKVMALNANGATGSTVLFVDPTNDDAKNGCNLSGGGSPTLVVSVSSSSTAVATVSPSSLSFTSCGDTKTVTVTPHAEGTANVTLSQTSNTSQGSFDLAPASFRVDVAPPPNTAPDVTVTGVTHGAEYVKGSVPVAGCSVEDVEDGNSTFSASLSAITGTYASDGLGDQTATCSYTDGGGIYEEVTATYSIYDGSAPSISPGIVGTLGNNDWYVSNVALSWTVTENESPNSLVKTGCVDQSITADQTAITYSCSASSAGGSTGPVSVVVKRDASAPSVTGAPATAAVAGWYKAAVTIDWACSDNGPSGLASSCPATTQISGEGRNLTTSLGPISDNAGNSTTGVSAPAVNIDKTAPNAPTGSATTLPDYSSAGVNWWKNSVTVGFSPNGDPDLADGSAGSGVASTSGSQSFSTSGVHTASGTSTDNAGNVSGAGTLNVNVDATQPNVSFSNCPTAAVLVGATVNVNWSASDAHSGLASAASGSTALNTSTVGSSKTVSTTATDNVGLQKSATCTYSVAYGFSGFSAPVDRPNTLNVSKAGQAIPLKWRLTDANGVGITTLTSVTVIAASASCAAGTTGDLLEEYAAGSSGLQNLGDGYYQFNWKTPSTYANSCKTIGLDLGEGPLRTGLALFSFKK